MPPESKRKPYLQSNICQPLFQQKNQPDKIITSPNFDLIGPILLTILNFPGERCRTLRNGTPIANSSAVEKKQELLGE
jgi:hypothetical protein